MNWWQRLHRWRVYNRDGHSTLRITRRTDELPSVRTEQQTPAWPFPSVTMNELKRRPSSTAAIRNWAGVLDPSEPPQAGKPVQEPHEPDYLILRGMRDRGCVLVDVGGNVGQTILSARAVNPNIPIFSFEPNPIAFSFLRETAKSSGAAVCCNIGLGEKACELDLHIPVIDGLLVTPLAAVDPASLGTPEMRAWILHIAAGTEVRILRQRIRILPGDDFGMAPSLLKIDVEGHELACVRGLAATILRERPLIMMEKNLQASIELLRMGFGAFVFHPESHTLSPLALHEGMDIAGHFR